MSTKRDDLESPFFENDDAARFLHFASRTLAKKRIDGTGPKFLKIGKKILYDRADLIDWARSHGRTSTSDEGGAA